MEVLGKKCLDDFQLLDAFRKVPVTKTGLVARWVDLDTSGSTLRLIATSGQLIRELVVTSALAIVSIPLALLNAVAGGFGAIRAFKGKRRVDLTKLPDVLRAIRRALFDFPRWKKTASYLHKLAVDELAIVDQIYHDTVWLDNHHHSRYPYKSYLSGDLRSIAEAEKLIAVWSRKGMKALSREQAFV